MLVAMTGAAGFLGAHTVRRLHGAGHRVRALVRTPAPGDSPIAPYVAQWSPGDQNDAGTTERLVAGCDAVVHLAMDWAALQEGPIANAERNELAALRLLEQARLAGVRQFVFVSSLDVYAALARTGDVDETLAACPGSIYGAFKAAVEMHLVAARAAYGMNTSAWRPATMYGVQPKLERALWFDVARAIARDEPAPAAPGGGHVVDVEDVARALALAIGDDAVAGELYNLADLHLDWASAAAIARSDVARARRPDGPHFVSAKAIAFFDRHADRQALRRGEQGVRAYLRQLVRAVRG